MTNMGGLNAGSITAALFLEEFVDGTPWAHIDIAGTAQADAASRWGNKGATGFGTRLLIDLAETLPSQDTSRRTRREHGRAPRRRRRAESAGSSTGSSGSATRSRTRRSSSSPCSSA